MRRNAIVIKQEDNVATAIQKIQAGTMARVEVEGREMGVKVVQDVPFGHKLALRHIGCGGAILKYGTAIGRAKQDIRPGEHVHVHNVESMRGRGDLA